MLLALCSKLIYLSFLSYHPYLFFNEDRASITFVGFNLKRNGVLLDPVRNQIIERTAMTRKLYTGI